MHCKAQCWELQLDRPENERSAIAREVKFVNLVSNSCFAGELVKPTQTDNPLHISQEQRSSRPRRRMDGLCRSPALPKVSELLTDRNCETGSVAMPITQTSPECLVLSYVCVIRTPMSVDAVPTMPLKHMVEERTLSRLAWLQSNL